MKIQKWLFPSKANKYHPHLLRPLGLSLVVVSLLAINITQNITSAHSFQVLGVATSISSSDVISLSNQERANNGLGALGYNARLTSAAEAKARDMFAKDYWAHIAPDGTTPWDFIHGAGYAYTTAGENLAKGFDTSSGVVQGWMNSPGHRANILNSAYRETGIAVMNGTLQGEQTTLVVAMYGATTSSPAPPASPTTPKASTPSTPAPVKKATVPSTATPTPVVAEQPAPAQNPAPTTATPEAAAPVVQAKRPTVAPTATVATPQAKTINQKAVAARESRTWAQNASLFLLCTLFLVSVLKHTIVWRTEKKGWRHIWLRAHPAAQYVLLFVAILANLVSGVGVIV